LIYRKKTQISHFRIEEIKHLLHFGKYLKNHKNQTNLFIKKYSTIYKEGAKRSSSSVTNSSSSTSSLKFPKTLNFKLKRLNSNEVSASPTSSPIIKSTRSANSGGEDEITEIDLDDETYEEEEIQIVKTKEIPVIVPKRKTSSMLLNVFKLHKETKKEEVPSTSTIRRTNTLFQRKNTQQGSFETPITKKTSLTERFQSQKIGSFSLNQTFSGSSFESPLKKLSSLKKFGKSEKVEKVEKVKKVSRVSYDLSQVLMDEKKRTFLFQHAEKEYSTENIKFWEDVKEFKRINDSTQRMDKAEFIFRNYLSSDSEFEINTSRRLRKRNYFFNFKFWKSKKR
jgi:hypothetical protein